MKTFTTTVTLNIADKYSNLIPLLASKHGYESGNVDDFICEMLNRICTEGVRARIDSPIDMYFGEVLASTAAEVKQDLENGGLTAETTVEITQE